jgi:RNA polymerase sigma-B factor
LTSHEYSHLAGLFEEMAALDEDDPRRAGLREKLVSGHAPLATHIASRFRHRGESADDLAQVAMLGLINAVDRFDPSRGNDFLAFAIPTVMGEVRRHFRDSGWSMRVPRRLKELHLTISHAANQLSQRMGKAPTAKELAQFLELDVNDVYEGLEAGQAYNTTSLYQVVTDTDTEAEGTMLADTLGKEDPDLEGVENREALEPLLAQLPSREREILMLRFFGNMTQREIAQRVGISQMHVSRLLAETLENLRGRLLEEP